MTVRVPHFQIPFRIVNGKAAVVEQDSDAEVDGCVVTILAYTHGDLYEQPDFGRPDPTFSSANADRLAPLRQAVATFEPRASAVFAEDLARLDEYLIVIEARMTEREEG